MARPSPAHPTRGILQASHNRAGADQSFHSQAGRRPSTRSAGYAPGGATTKTELTFTRTTR